MYYQAKVELNKNERVTFEAVTKEELIKYMKNTLPSPRFSNDVINKIRIYEVKEIENMTYEQLLDL